MNDAHPPLLDHLRRLFADGESYSEQELWQALGWRMPVIKRHRERLRLALCEMLLASEVIVVRGRLMNRLPPDSVSSGRTEALRWKKS